MRKSILLSVLALVLVSNLVDLSRGDLKFCLKEKTYDDGTCGADGGYQCFLRFLGDFGARAMPQKCTCRPMGTSQRTCHCVVVCENDVSPKGNA